MTMKKKIGELLPDVLWIVCDQRHLIGNNGSKGSTDMAKRIERSGKTNP